MAQRPLSKQQEAFIREYLVSLNASDAYRRAGYKSKSPNVDGPALLANPRIAEAIAQATQQRFERLDLDADALIKRAETILKADARQLTGHHIGACRYCWGIDHEYQWKTPREWREADEEAEKRDKPSPSQAGGYGYRITRKPNPDCPECSGLGIPYTQFADTRDLSGDALLLFEGVKETRNGIEIQMASKQAAFDLLAKHHGLAVNRHEVTGKDGKPIQHDVKVKAKVVLVPPKVEAPTETRPLKPDPGDAPC